MTKTAETCYELIERMTNVLDKARYYDIYIVGVMYTYYSKEIAPG